MMTKFVVLCLVFGLVFADPVARLSSSIDNLDASVYDVVDTKENKRVARLVPDLLTLVFEVIKAVISKKFNALSFAVSCIDWLVTNSVVIVIGAVIALGICKLTGQCSLSYQDVLPVPEVSTYVSPEHLDTAEQFLVSAIEKYAEENHLF